MVDTTFGIGQVQGSASTNRVQNSSNERRSENVEEARESREIQDEIQISAEALDQLQAEEAAREVAAELAQNEEQTLGLDPSFDRDDA